MIGYNYANERECRGSASTPPGVAPKGLVSMRSDVITIPLTRGMNAVVDAEDYPLVEPFIWRVQFNGHNTYYAVAGKNGLRMHRLILGVTDSHVPVDHRNRDGLDNRRDNLRIATPQLNRANAQLGKRSTSGYKGAQFEKRCGRWFGVIYPGGKSKFLGYFDSPEGAARAYDRAALELWGDAAATNVSLGLLDPLEGGE